MRTTTDSGDAANTEEYIQEREDFEDKQEHFLRKYFNKEWPKRIVAVLGVLQLLISLAALGVDLPVMLMNAPRWQVLAGLWSFLFGFIACVGTLHSTRKVTMLKLYVAVGLNVLAALVTTIMLIFNIMFASNPYTCIVSSGCNYLKYTYAQATSFYIGEIVLGLFFLATVVVYIILFMKYGIGAKTRFENINRGYAPTNFSNFNPMGRPNNNMTMPMNGKPGPGFMPSGPPRPGFNPRNPGQPPAGMMGGPRGPMMGGPRGPMMGPGPRGPQQQFYRQPGAYPSTVRPYQN